MREKKSIRFDAKSPTGVTRQKNGPAPLPFQWLKDPKLLQSDGSLNAAYLKLGCSQTDELDSFIEVSEYSKRKQCREPGY